MRAPGFWSRPPGLLSAALSPLAAVWAWQTARWVARPPRLRPDVPVICVGNVNAGGTGKTPVAAALLQRLADGGASPAVLSRGHGGRLEGPVRVDERAHDAADVGDEPLMLAGFGPVWVARDRVAGARAAMAAGADVLVMDDGFQNPDLAKDLSILVIDAGAGFGNGRVIPAGPLREPVDAALARAGLVVLLGPAAARARFLRDWPQVAAMPLAQGDLAPLPTGMPWQGLPCLAFAGIGRPEKFYATLRGLGVDLRGTRSFADHQPYARPILERLSREAGKLGAQLVTTEKDMVRLPADFRAQVRTVPVRLELEDWAPLDAALAALRA